MKNLQKDGTSAESAESASDVFEFRIDTAGTKLYEDRESGIFQEAESGELVLEFITMLERLEHEIAIFAAPNTTPPFPFVDLQPQKKELLDFMRKYINELDEKQEEQIAKQRSSGRSV